MSGMATFSVQKLNFKSNNVLANSSSQLSQDELQNKIYYKQLLEIFKLTVSFLLTNIAIRLLDNTFLNYYLKTV